MSLVRLLAIAMMAATPQAGATIPPGAPLQEEPGLTGTQRDEVMEIIENYLITNPDIIARALDRLGKNTAEGNVDRLMLEAPKAARDAFQNPAIGFAVDINPKGSPTLVLGWDASCPFCATMAPRIDAMMRMHPEYHYVFRDMPILGRASVLAAKTGAAIARQGQERYLAYVFALLSHRGMLDERVILEAATTAKADLTKVAADVEDPAIDQGLATNIAIAKSLGVLSTPMITAAGRFYNEAISAETLEQAMRDGLGK